MDERTISSAGDPFIHAAPRDQDAQVRPCACYEGIVYLGRITLEEDTGEEVEVIEAVPCRRCAYPEYVREEV